MKTKIILSLYNGDYTFIERASPKDKKYTDNLSKCISIEDELKKLLDTEKFSLVEKVLFHQNQMSAVEMENAFAKGFSLALSLLLETLSEK